MIDVEHDDPDGLFSLSARFSSLIQTLFHMPPVKEAGQGIADGLLMQRSFSRRFDMASAMCSLSS
jgi:hypothetical protein